MSNYLFKQVLFMTLLAFFAACSGGGDEDSTSTSGMRSITGTTSLPSLTNAPRAIKAALTRSGAQTIDECDDVQICCTGYDTSDLTVADVEADCSFSISLPLESFCFCGIYSGEDSDGDGCKDDFIATAGCSEGGYSGAIPIFEDIDGGTDAIDLGTVTIEGQKVVSENDPCVQVDQDGDGIADATDDDDDGDALEDEEEAINDDGCWFAEDIDIDGNGIPDIYDFDLWLELDDADSDNVPDLCDVDVLIVILVDEEGSETFCETSDDDTDGDCLPDAYDWCSGDFDEDGYVACLDCDDDDATVTDDCYSGYCEEDNDQDGYSLCDDCDDGDPAITYDCIGDEYCAQDDDADGFDTCVDCDDSDSASNVECYADDICAMDNDGDGFDICYDCDDFDPSINSDCYPDDYCDDIDGDLDGFNVCVDCDDEDDTVGTECLFTDFCDEDTDGDGVGYCEDCDDENDSITDECFSGCGAESTSCSTDFECQLFGEAVDPGGDVEDWSCLEGCCEEPE